MFISSLLIASCALLLLVILWRLVLSKIWQRWHAAALRQTVEDALKFLHTREHERGPASLQALSGSLGISAAKTLHLIEHMEAQALLQSSAKGLRLTALGHSWALQVIRAHRLWERYLADEVGTPWNEMHYAAEQKEHVLTPQEVDELDAHLGHPRLDPHGDPIPTAGGEEQRIAATALSEWPLKARARITHVEDEPPEVFEQIIAEGLLPGVEIEVLANNALGLFVQSEAGQHLLAPLVAANIFVGPAAGTPKQATRRLSTLAPGQSGRVVGLECQGLTRRRFLDLGLTPNALVRAELQNPFGDPMAYRIRGALVALRREHARQVLIQPEGEA